MEKHAGYYILGVTWRNMLVTTYWEKHGETCWLLHIGRNMEKHVGYYILGETWRNMLVTTYWE